MMNVLKVCVIAACFFAVTSAAVAQENVHALSGTVESVNAKIKMTEIDTDNGTSGHFEWLKKTGTDINFDKAVKADATDADKFTTKGAHVIVYFIGDGDIRTIIAVHDLGSGPLEKTSGTVVKLSRKDHLLTIKSSAGAEETFHLDAKTVADTTTGVEEGFRFDFSKGDEVRVTAAPSNGGETALLIAPIM
jgi:hypothetical protein